MRSKFLYHLIILPLSLAVIFTAWPWPAGAQSPTTFTYQGRLQHGAGFVDGVTCNFDFLLYDAVGGGSQLGPIVSTSAPVTDGYFSVALDFGDVFTQTIRYLQINSINCGNPGDPINLSSRIPLRGAPYAQYANTAGSATQVNWTNIISKPAGFADNADNGVIINCSNNQTLRWAGGGWACANALNDHGGLKNLENDDHPQYIRPDGTRPMTGALNLGNNRIVNLTPGGAISQAVTYEQAVKVGDPAGGDLSGAYPNPTITKIHAYPVTSTLPASGQIFTWDGSQWAPAQTQTGGTAGGDLSGSYPNPTVVQLQGRLLANTAPLDKQVLSWNGASWTPTDAIDNPENASGDLASQYPNPRVARLQGQPVGNSSPTTGDMLSWNGSQWTPTAAGAGGAAGGDLSGTYPNPTVAGLQGRTIAATTPSTNQFFGWDGSQWTPTAVTHLQGRSVSATAPTSNQVLVWNGSAWTPTTVLKPGDTAGGDLTGTYPNPQLGSNVIMMTHVNIPMGKGSDSTALAAGTDPLYIMPANFTPDTTGACLVMVSAQIKSTGSATSGSAPTLKTAKRVGATGTPSVDDSWENIFSPDDLDNDQQTVIAAASYIWDVTAGEDVYFGCYITDPYDGDWGTDETATCRVSYLCQ